MKAAVWYGKKDIRVEERALKEMKADELKVKVAWTGICGTDLHEYEHGPIFIPADGPDPITGGQAPVTLGHEFTGVVEEVGFNVKDLKAGDRIAVYPIITKGLHNPKEDIFDGFSTIGLNIDGGFADYAIIPEKNAFKLPETLSLAEGALVEPAAVAVQAVKEANLVIGDSVAVFGSGPIGLLTIMAAKTAGARNIIALDVSETRLEKAIQLGATHIINSMKTNPVEEIRKICPNGVDVSFEVAGIEATFKQAIQSTKIRGLVTIVSIFSGSIEWNPFDLTNGGVKVMATLAYEPVTFQQTIDLISTGQLDVKKVITSQIELDDIVEKGIKALINDKSQVKILVKLSGEM
ncbi:zinc-binding dehydrogenase [Bacillus benzoevorans]|uniref:(R,R)-butanediol dehydrogenase/meso-butanediol dehydrogenase/diacetyl reductase n=1 Tax=Bacillus benzoevorans TaxID=1456 RepID=A0A7X0HTX0_9BACI|nr:(R,R)-butanediol dehydrogenase/meso-butanediol dehydrogenase/diacetyl reductase [Bacillus benzoevorans]